jgi:isoleucyl-tRNA synthetase
MHKSWGNSVEFNEGADKIGVDVMRWMYVRQNPADNLLFGYKTADETRRRFHLILWNVYNFFVTYANIDEWKPNDDSGSIVNNSKLTPLDKWILSQLSKVATNVTKSLEKYDAMVASEEIEKFVINDLSLWYIRRSRDRVGPAAESKEDKKIFYEVTFYMLEKLSKLTAPFIPFISEVIFKNLTKKESVHLEEWPEVEFKHNVDLERNMRSIRGIVEQVHAERKEKKIPVRQPLANLYVFYPINEEVWKTLGYLVSDELNIKNIIFKYYEEIEKDKKLEPYFKKNFFLDTTITPELEEEAKARELIRKIQEERKTLGLGLTEKIRVNNPWIPKDEKLKEKILRKTLGESLNEGEFKVVKV